MPAEGRSEGSAEDTERRRGTGRKRNDIRHTDDYADQQCVRGADQARHKIADGTDDDRIDDFSNEEPAEFLVHILAVADHGISVIQTEQRVDCFFSLAM